MFHIDWVATKENTVSLILPETCWLSKIQVESLFYIGIYWDLRWMPFQYQIYNVKFHSSNSVSVIEACWSFDEDYKMLHKILHIFDRI